MDDKRILSVASKIDELNYEVHELIEEIRESNHPRASAVADAIADECHALASAVDCAKDSLNRVEC